MKFLLISIIGMLLVSGCTSQSPAPAQGTNNQPDTPAEEQEASPQETALPQDFLDDALTELDQTEDLSDVHEISVSVGQWQFTPNPIQGAKDEQVLLHVTSEDVTHGFWVPELGINKEIPAGQTVDIMFSSDTAGTYNVICSVFCGDGHSGMKGTIVVTP